MPSFTGSKMCLSTITDSRCKSVALKHLFQAFVIAQHAAGSEAGVQSIVQLLLKSLKWEEPVILVKIAIPFNLSLIPVYFVEFS